MRLVAGLIFVAGFLGSFSASAQEAPDTLRETHGDWQKHCALDATGLEECFLFQAVDEQANGERVMTVIAANPAAAEPLLRITVPLGALLPNGLNMTVDGIDLGTVGFLTCFMDGCMTQVTLTADVLGNMKAGNQALITIYDTVGQPASLPLSLSGFTAAWGALGN
ncbi:MAG: invasion associated locus B family protein [Alphaproteobacteria bacterium]|jgi:invasion protein IalB